MQVVVTGGAGFIGSHAAGRFLDDGHRVWVIDDLRTGVVENIPDGAEFIRLDINDEKIEKLLISIKPDAVFHFAAQVDVRVSCQNPVMDARENILATLRLIEAGLASGMGYFGFASSGGAIYGEAAAPQDESHRECPVSPYGVAKLAVDKYLASYRLQKGLASCSMRFANVYGPRQGARGEAGVVAVFCNRLVRGLPPRINGDGLQTRDFLYVGDLAEAAGLVLARRPEGVLNLGTGVATRVLDLADLLCRFAGSGGCEHAPAIPGEQRRSLLDPAKAERELGWRPATPLKEGLALTYAWFDPAFRKPSSGALDAP